MSSNNNDMLIAAGLVVAAVMYSRKTAIPVGMRPVGTGGGMTSLPGNIGTGIGQAVGGALGGWLKGLLGSGTATGAANTGGYGLPSTTDAPSASWEVGSNDTAAEIDASAWA